MSEFKLQIFQGNDTRFSPKWYKKGDLNNWQQYQFFYCNGGESIVSLDLGGVWHTMLKQKQIHIEQPLLGDETVLNGRFWENNKVPFFVAIDVRR